MCCRTSAGHYLYIRRWRQLLNLVCMVVQLPERESTAPENHEDTIINTAQTIIQRVIIWTALLCYQSNHEVLRCRLRRLPSTAQIYLSRRTGTPCTNPGVRHLMRPRRCAFCAFGLCRQLTSEGVQLHPSPLRLSVCMTTTCSACERSGWSFAQHML